MAGNNQLAPKTLGDYMTPTRVPQTASIVRPNLEANDFELKLALLQLIQKEQFTGGSTENPYSHLDNFLLYCDTLKVNGVPREAILLRLFPCSLKDEGRDWLQFFSASKMARLKAEITAFEQKESESLYEAWERFKGSLRKCPQHGIEAWEKARIFFQRMTSSTRTLVNAAAGGSLKTKTPEEALELLESLASQEFDNAPAPVAPRRARIMELKEAHAIEDCDYMRTTEKPPAEVNGLWYDQKNQNQHPGLSHKSNHQLNPPLPVQPDTPQQSNTSEWEKTFAQLCKTTSDYVQGANAFREDTSAFMQETRAAHRNQEASIRNLKIQIGQLSKQFSERAQGTFPSNTVVNPREHCNAITTRSAEKKLFKWEKKKALERQNKPLDLFPYARIPYPQRLKKEIQKQQCSKFLDIFK
ncbi:uncharacterized protein LOC133288614, partial [Gastrolobium bilobum]|uniref:uncharacterized protein LOC133288614 n=1 Tax=Gastrolobium bilobum TaxID=150636 RepID=UPI002AB0C3C4